jgi:hypothetical protein
MSERPRPPGVDRADLRAGLAARPRDRRGLPIPPVNLHPDPATGQPAVDFTTINTKVSTALAADRRCSLCDGEIGYWAAFLGAPRAAELMQYADPPGCVDCMTWAVKLCPFIVVQRHRRLSGDLAGGGELPPGSHGEKPPYWVLGILCGLGCYAGQKQLERGCRGIRSRADRHNHMVLIS